MNAPLRPTPPPEPFYLPCAPGQRLCVLQPPSPYVAPCGTALYIPPFGDELEHLRRMAAEQSRAWAARGVAVLRLDLFGCGDSSGNFCDARWALWLQDVATAAQWLQERYPGPHRLWGCRGGALLALSRLAMHGADSLVLWQAFLTGRACVNQLLRSGLGTSGQGVAALRQALWHHGQVDAGGYRLSAQLAQELDQIDLAHLDLPPRPVDWFYQQTRAADRIAASLSRHAARWQAGGVQLHLHPYQGGRFWSARQGAMCQPLLDATSALLAEGR